MKTLKRVFCLCLMLAMLTALVLPGHALGTRLSGTVTSYGDATEEISLWLTPMGAAIADYEEYLTGNKAQYSLTNLKSGDYTLTVLKEGHVTRVYEVTIGTSDVTLDLQLCPLGDVSGDGRINVMDVSLIYAHCKGTSLLKDPYKLACADCNGNGKVNVADTSGIYSMVKGTYQPVKAVTLSVWAPDTDMDGSDSWLLQMEEAFQKAHPEYKITWDNGVCHEGDAASFIITDPEAAADVYMFANDQIGTLLDAGAILPLTGQYRNQVLTDNAQAMVNTVTFTDGQVYGFPVSNNTWFMYYNKDVFTEEDVKSLDTMLTKGTVAFPWSTGWYSGTFFLANGGTIFGENGIDAADGIHFGAEKGGYEAALKMVQLAAHPNFVEDANGFGAFGLTTGEIDAFFSGSWEAPYLREFLGDKLGAVQLPTVEIGGEQKQMKAFAGSKAVGVNPHADNTELAMAFAAFLATPEAQKLRYEYRGVIPAASTLTDDPAISQDPIALAEMNTIKNAAVVQPTLPEMAYYWNPVGQFGTLIANGEVNEYNYKEQVEHLMVDLNTTL